MRHHLKALSCVGLLAALASGSAGAAFISNGGLTLDTAPGVYYQQTVDDPCIIGNNDCKNPVTFPYADVGVGGGGGVERNISTIFYTVGQITNTLGGGGSSFIIGFDYNDSSEPQLLHSFQACYFGAAAGGGVGAQISCQTFDPAADVSLKTVKNGVGFSDFLLSGFTLAAGTQYVRFNAQWFQNDGPDSYFLIGASDTPPVVPEPGTLVLLGLGLGALGLARRRRA